MPPMLSRMILQAEASPAFMRQLRALCVNETRPKRSSSFIHTLEAVNASNVPDLQETEN